MYGVDHWEAKHRAAWSPWPNGVPTKKRGWPHGCVRPPAFTRRTSPPPSSRATCGRYEGGSGGVRGRREAEVAAHRRRRVAGDLAERVEAAGGNAAAVAGGLLGDSAEGVPGSVVARESRASGGSGEFGRKRGLSPPAAHPHPKRRAVSASRQFPPGCGRDSAVPIVRTGGDDGSPLGDTPSHGGFSVSKQSARAPPSCSGATEEGGLLLEPATANAGFRVPEKFVAAECGAPTAGGYHHGPESTVVKSLVASVRNAVGKADGLLENWAQGVAGLVVGRGGAPWSGELGKNDSVPIPRLPLNSKMVCAKLRFPHGCRTDFVAPVNSEGYEALKKDALDGAVAGQEELEEGEVSVAMDIVKTLKKDALDGAVARQEELEGEVAVGMDIAKTLKKTALDGAVEGQEELEEGEIAGTMYIVEAVKKGELEGAVAGQEELEEGEVAVAMDIMKTLKKNALNGTVAGQEELEEGEVAVAMDIMKTFKKNALDGAVAGQEELEKGEVSVAMDIVKTLKKDALDEAVAGQEELEEGEVAVAMDIAKTLKKTALDGAVEGREELEEGEIAATMYIVEAVKKDELEGAVAGQEELEEGEVAVAMDIVKTFKKNALDGAVAGQEELEEVEVAVAMDIVKTFKKNALDGAVAGQEELEEGEIAAAMYNVEAVKKGELEGAVECQELEQGEIAATMDIVEAWNKLDLDGAVQDLELEQSEIAATGGIVEALNKHALDGLTKGLELKEGEIASTMDIVGNMNKDDLYEPIHDQKLEGDITAKGHGSELVEHEIAAESDHIIQESQVSVDDVIPRDFITGNMSTTESDHIVQGSIPHDSIAGIMRSKIRLTPRKLVRPPVKAIHISAQSKHLVVNVSSTSLLASKEKHPFKFLFVSKEKLKDKWASHLEDDDILKAVAVYKGKLELYLNVPSCDTSIRRHSQNQGQNGDARSKVRMLCSRFQFLCRFLVQAVEQRLLEVWRIDLAADKVIRNLPGFTKHGAIVGKVPGVEVGDEFRFRVELAIVGLHRPYRGGIDTTKDTNGVLIAISIVASGGYPGELSSSGELIYTGSGGKAAGKEHNGDQRLERGNLALKNCIKTKTPVRVIHGFKGQNRKITTFAYDGMYLLVDCWWEGLPGSRAIKYRLQRISGQPKLPLHIAKWLRRSVVGPGLYIAGISQGKERVHIRLKNNADNVRPDCHTRD